MQFNTSVPSSTNPPSSPFANSPPSTPYYPLGLTLEEAGSIINKVRKLEMRLTFCIDLAWRLEDQIGNSQQLLLAPSLHHSVRKILDPLNAGQILNAILLNAQVQSPPLHPNEVIPKIATFINYNLAAADFILFKQGSLHAAAKAGKRSYITALDIIRDSLCLNMQTAPQRIANSTLPFTLSGVLTNFKNTLQANCFDSITLIHQLSTVSFPVPMQNTTEEPALKQASPTSTLKQTIQKEKTQEMVASSATTLLPPSDPALAASAARYISIRKDGDILYTLPKMNDNNRLELLIIFYDALCKIESFQQQEKDTKFVVRHEECQLMHCGPKNNTRNYKLSIKNIFLRLFHVEGITFLNPNNKELTTVFNYPEQDLKEFGTTPLRKMLLKFLDILKQDGFPTTSALISLLADTIKELNSRSEQQQAN